VVFTLPQIIARLALQNKRVMYDILFRAASQTLLQVAANPKHLGAKLGFFGVLHTWGQQLENHPHIHFVIPGGGISPDHSRWVPCKRSKKRNKKFFLPVKVLGKVFRGKFLHFLRAAYQRGELSFHGNQQSLAEVAQFERFLNASVKHNWVVYVKRPFGGPERALKYLARYTHRVAISNSRLLSIDGGKVRFSWKDYRHGCVQRTREMDAVEFLRRFLQHALPKRFMRIRHFGFLCNRLRTPNLALCRKILGVDQERCEDNDPQAGETETSDPASCGTSRCPLCKVGRMVILESWPRAQRMAPPTSLHRALVISLDTL
jgi:hypothetical protein